jgi:hypothetical protein
MTGKKQVFAVSEAEYGERYKADLMTQFNNFVATTSEVSTWRYNANGFFSTINTALLTSAGLLGDKSAGLHWQIAVAGVLLCVIWRRMILSCRALNNAKFKVILDIEKQLPLAPFTVEDRYFNADGGKSLTSVEKWVPVLFMVAYILVVLFQGASLPAVGGGTP